LPGGFQYDEFSVPRGHADHSQPPASRAELQAALELKSTNPKTHQYLASYYLLFENDLAKAEEHYRRAYELDSTDATILNDLGVLAWHQGEFRKAMQQFHMALKRDAGLAEAQYNLATLHQQQGEAQQALRAWETYLKLDSTSVWADIARDHVDQLR